MLENKQVRRSFFLVLFMPYNKSFIDQGSSVKMAGYWPRSLFCVFMETEKENLANIQPYLPRAWPTCTVCIQPQQKQVNT